MEYENDTSIWEGAIALQPDFALEPKKTAFLIIDMQYLDAHPDYGMGRRAKENGTSNRFVYYYQTVKEIIPRIQRLQEVSRRRGIEVVFVVIASYVKDCRDVSLQHKGIELFAPAGSKEAQVLEEIAPLENEIVLIKGCSGAFNGTAIDQILRNMGIDTLIVCGVVTNGCVESAVRDASDRSYKVILVSDACATVTPEHHLFSLRTLNNIYCKVMTTQQVSDLIVATAEVVGSGARDV